MAEGRAATLAKLWLEPGLDWVGLAPPRWLAALRWRCIDFYAIRA